MVLPHPGVKPRLSEKWMNELPTLKIAFPKYFSQLPLKAGHSAESLMIYILISLFHFHSPFSPLITILVSIYIGLWPPTGSKPTISQNQLVFSSSCVVILDLAAAPDSVPCSFPLKSVSVGAPSPSARENRLFFWLFFPISTDGSGLQASATPCLAYMGDNEGALGTHFLVNSQAPKSPGSAPSFHLSESSCVCYVVLMNFFTCKRECLGRMDSLFIFYIFSINFKYLRNF